MLREGVAESIGTPWRFGSERGGGFLRNQVAKSAEYAIVSENQKNRLLTFKRTEKLSDEEALPVLRLGLTHWDRKLRNMCANELVKRLGGKAASIVLPLQTKGLLHATCSSEALLKNEDQALIKYLKRAKNHPVVGDLVRKLLLRTKFHIDSEARIIARKEAEAKKERLKREKKENVTKREAVIDEKESEAYDNYWISDPEIPILKDLNPRCAEYVYRHWVTGRDIDSLYKIYEIPKRSGGMRQIEAPCVSLKMTQKTVLKNIFGEVFYNDACHGFRTKHSIATNAFPHVGKDVVINLDLKDFFPSITAGRIYGIYKSFVGEGKYARFLTDISTFNGRLPQGAPTSPMIANLACIRLDRRFTGFANKNGMNYTRYADDLTFSGQESIVRYIPTIKKIIEDEGFKIALPKLRIHRKGSRQDVTGLTVNQRVSVPRAIRRRLRAAVHASSKGNPPTWKGIEITPQALEGHINFISSIHPELGSQFLKQIKHKAKGKRA